MNNIAKYALVAVLSAGFVGCVETGGTRITIDTTTGEASVLECSSRLANRVRVVRAVYGDVAGIKKATITLESLTHRRQELQARIVWLDAEGSEIDADGKSYRAIVLDGGDVTTVSGMAPNDRAVTARVQVRETSTIQ